MAVTSNRIPLTGLARKLVADGLLDEHEASRAFQAAVAAKIPFVKYVVDQKLVDPKTVAHAASQEFGVPLIDIELAGREVESA